MILFLFPVAGLSQGLLSYHYPQCNEASQEPMKTPWSTSLWITAKLLSFPQVVEFSVKNFQGLVGFLVDLKTPGKLLKSNSSI